MTLQEQIEAAVESLNWGVGDAAKRGRNPAYPYVPIIRHAREGRLQTTNPTRRVAFATREEATACAQRHQRHIDDLKALTRKTSPENPHLMETDNLLPEVQITVRVHKDSLDPEAVTRALGFLPDVAAKKGEPFSENEGAILAPTGTWLVTLPGFPFPESDWPSPPQGTFSEFFAERLRDASANVDISILIIGPAARVATSIQKHAADLAAFMSAEAHHADVDIDVPNLGIDWVLRRGLEIDGDQLLADLNLGEVL